MSHQSELISQDILGYLKQHEEKDLLRLLTCGNVDDGKSTLIGRLLHDSKLIYEDHLDAVKRDSKKSGTQGEEVDLALLVDGLQAEREQGITIDVAYRYFSTEKRKFIIADTPGHEQYTRNMATGASTCDLAVILIDARYGVQTQTRRHSYIASLLGIKHVVVAVNKMDLVDFSEERFNQIRADYLAFLEWLGDRKPEDVYFVPMSALRGDNVVNASAATPWYQGGPLMQILESVQIDRDVKKDSFRFPVQYVNRPNLDFRGFSGTVAAGQVKPGDAVVALPSGKRSTVAEIVTYDGSLDVAKAGQAVTITLADEIDVSRGDMLVHVGDEPSISTAMRASVVWMAEQPLVPGKLYDFKIGTQTVPGKVTKINHRVDVNTLEHSQVDRLELNVIADCDLQFDAPVAFDKYQDSRLTGALIVIDRLSNVTVGAGMVEDVAAEVDANGPVTAEERAARLGQKPAIVAVDGVEPTELERALLKRGVVALATAASGDVLSQLKQTGVVILVTANGEGDLTVSATKVDEAVEQIVALVSL
ncbi:sulfate adenylyltransferase subunit CysN [Maribrevibacterium harenarium]|uniref:Sulfate adenylyltransferase subunit 1 n=1 Tax=Maribrevibacterium harenarium TaxID=2589817 RepID=A0A501WXV0_9GAMM|nr:sulfate adenylyltransferase subunit CysN [Maribrevibacterium harenarium]TPE52297.1 sulfate adenylyltransferase subunit CysN [Maribrevibacterium harenarium]